MKHIVLVVVSEGITAKETAVKCLQRIAHSKGHNWSCAKDNTFVKIVTTAPEAKELSDDSCFINNWLSLEEAISALTRADQQENAEECVGVSVSSAMESVARGLHDAADSLPYLGSSVNIILCLGCPEAVAVDSDSVIAVAGALRRLTDWHSGCAVVVKLRHELSPLECDLLELVRCQVINSVDELSLNWPVWRGKVAVMDHLENKGHMFPGCWLESLDWDLLVQQKLMCRQQASTDRQSGDCTSSLTAVCGRPFEVLQEVDLRTFPLCLLDSWSLHLNTAEQHSEILLKYIQDLDTAGLLARLRVYPDISKIPLSGSMNLSTAAWKDRVVSDLENLQEPAEEPITDDWLYLYFLLLPNPGGSHVSSVVAQVLLSPHEINGSVLPFVENQILSQKLVTKRNRNRWRNEMVPCEELVLDQRDRFVVMLNLIKENLQCLLTDCQDDGSKEDNAYENLVSVAADVQGQILSAAFQECKSVKDFLQDDTGCKIKWFTGSAIDASKFPEKLALQAAEATRKTLQSFLSMDSLTSSPSPTVAEVVKKKDTIDFDVNDVLEYFNHDGSFKEMIACPVKSAMKGRGLCRVNTHCMTNLQWPESMLLNYPDIFYYTSDINWSLEKRYSKVRDRGYFPDTRSSFVSPVKKAPQTHSMLRRSASVQSPVTDSKPERSRRMSLRKERLLSDIFKQPPNHLCSPRKQPQGTLKSVTPELPLLTVSKSLEQVSSDSRPHSAELPKRSDLRHTAELPKRSDSKAHTEELPKRSDSRAHTEELPKRSQENVSRIRALNQRTSSTMDISHQSPRKRSLTSTESGIPYKRNRISSSVDDVDLLCPVRRSPRRSARPLNFSLDQSVNGDTVEKPRPSQLRFAEGGDASAEQQRVRETSLGSVASEQASAKMKRSDRHRLKLQRIIDHVLREKGVQVKDRIYAACSRNLFNVSLVLLKTLTTSQNLTEEMKTVVYGQVTQIINLEKRRCGMAL